jgi:hypothetical protein
MPRMGAARCIHSRRQLPTKDNNMADKGGRKDKGKKEIKKKPLLSPKEKRKAKAEKQS